MSFLCAHAAQDGYTVTSVEEKEENLAAKDSEGLNQTDYSSAEVPQLLENSQLEINDMATFSEENRRGFPMPCPSLQPQNRHKLTLGQNIQRSEMLCSQSDSQQG